MTSRERLLLNHDLVMLVITMIVRMFFYVMVLILLFLAPIFLSLIAEVLWVI